MISVVVPIYNMEPYLARCVDSLLSQTYADLEIILVNDGSTDGSPTLCERYAAQDSRIKVLHKPNGGLSDARNAGVEAATGEWIYFVDSDDWLDRDAIGRLYDFAVTGRCDVVQGNMYYVYADYMLYRKADRKERRTTVLGREEAMRGLIVNDRIKNFAWGKLYRAKLIKDLPFPVGKYFEDSFWQHYVIDRTERYGIVDTPLYYYRQRADSISGTPSERFEDLLEGNRERMAFVERKYPSFVDLMRRRYDELYNSIHPANNRRNPLKSLLSRVRARLCGPEYCKIRL